MTDAAETARLVADCEAYWRSTGVPRRAVISMRNELQQHVDEALADGRSVADVVGDDPAAFAESWAAEHRASQANRTWDTITRGEPTDDERRFSLISYSLGGLAILIGIVAGSILRGDGDVDNETWRWVWTIAAVGFGIGEIFTAAFFLLPFAIGAVAAALLAWLGVALLPQWLVFFGVSLIAFAYLRRFIAAQDAMDQPRVGANRWIGLAGIVLEEIDNDAAAGMVRVESEEWRAVADDGHIIPAGTHIEVTGIKGARLVVSPIDR